MKLLTKEILKKLPALYSNEKNPDPVAVVKFFTPWTSWTWYATEGEPVDAEGVSRSEFIAYKTPGEFKPVDFRFFGLVSGHEEELGYFVLSELESVRGPFGLKIERDLYFDPTPLSKLRKAA